MGKEQPNAVKAALYECRPLIFGALMLSFVINMLGLAVPIFSMQVLDRVLSSGSKNTLIMLTSIAIAAVVFSGLLTALRSTVFAQISRWLDDKIASNLVHQTIELAVARPSVGSQPARDLGTVRAFISSQTIGSILDAPWAIIFFIVLYMINVTIGLIITIAAIILLILAFLAQKVPSRLIAAAGDAQIRSIQSLDFVVRNAEVVKAMGMSVAATNRWRELNETSIEKGYHAGNLGTVISNLTKTLRMGLQIAITAVGAWLVINGQMSMGAIIAVNMLAGKALAPFDAAVAIYQGTTNTKKAYDRLKAVFKTQAENDRRVELPEPKGKVSVINLTYQHPVTKQILLKNISFEISSGKSIGIIGPSGGGKTTLARMLVNILSPSSGSVSLDGARLDQWQRAQLAAAIGYLPQDIELFTGTIAQNIARMEPEANDEDIVAAAQAAEVHEFILSLPAGYQTDVGPNGANLSGGQRQRIALARCFYGAPKLIVLDEPNSNLDTNGEQALVQAMLNAKQLEISMVIVAHRPALLHHVDQILVLKGGEVALAGDAKDVLDKIASTSGAPNHLKVGGGK